MTVDEIRKEHAIKEYNQEIAWNEAVLRSNAPANVKADAKRRIEIAEAGKRKLEAM